MDNNKLVKCDVCKRPNVGAVQMFSLRGMDKTPRSGHVLVRRRAICDECCQDYDVLY